MPASKALLAPFKAQARGLFLAPLMLTLDRQHALLCLTVAVPDRVANAGCLTGLLCLTGAVPDRLLCLTGYRVLCCCLTGCVTGAVPDRCCA